MNFSHQPQEVELLLFAASHAEEDPRRRSAPPKSGRPQDNVLPTHYSANNMMILANKEDFIIGQVVLPYETIPRGQPTGNDVSQWINLTTTDGDATATTLCCELSLSLEHDASCNTLDSSTICNETNYLSFINVHPTDVIFKVGDDLRQDQLAMQLIRVMDTLLKQSNLDLHLTLYRVCPTSPNAGFMEFVENSYAMSAVLENHSHNILHFLREFNFDITAENQIAPHAMDIYLKSSAGFCVITYILGVGDRLWITSY